MSASGTYVDFGTRFSYVAAAMAEGVKTNQFPPAVLRAAVDLVELAEESVEETRIPRNPVTSACAYSLVAQTLRTNFGIQTPRQEVNNLIKKLGSSLRILKDSNNALGTEELDVLGNFFSRLAQDSEERAYDFWCSGRPSKYSFSI